MIAWYIGHMILFCVKNSFIVGTACHAGLFNQLTGRVTIPIQLSSEDI